MAGREPDAKTDIEAEQDYLAWALGHLKAALVKAERGPLTGDGAVDRQLLRMRQQKAAELRAARDALLIGRIDIEQTSEVAGTWYVGRADLADETYATVVVDWRSDLGGRFYEAGRGDPRGVGRRRTFGTTRNTIASIHDETLIPGFTLPGHLQVDGQRRRDDARRDRDSRRGSAARPVASRSEADRGSAADGPDSASTPGPTRPGEAVIGDLRARDLLLAELERDRTAHMNEIVTTIQADQDKYIRMDPARPLVVQGGPGTGKTVVGLHRAAYLLYKQRERSLEQSILIVGPNSAFMEYIGAVLPSLGETSSRQQSVAEMMVSALRPADRKALGIRLAVDTDAGARVKGDPAMGAVAARAVWAHAAPQVVEVGFGAMHARIDEWEVADLLDRAAHGRTYDDVRRSFADQLAQALATKLRAQAAEHDRSLFSGDVAAFTEHAVRKLRKAGVPSAILPQVSASMVLNKLLEEPDFLTMVAGQVLTASERAALHPTDAAISKGRRRDRSLADLALLDEIASVLGAEVERFDHVIVDEAQDLSPMQWRSIKRRTRAGGLTILGDLAQATGVWSPASWQQLLDHLGFGATGQVGELRLGYRVPRPILDFASQLLPVAAPKVPQPVSYRNGRSPGRHRVSLPEVWDTVRAAVDGTDGRIAVIAPANADVPMTMAPSGGASPLVLTPEESKGLEFDHVVVIEPAEIASTGRRGLRQLYVALTRSTKRLDIVHTQDLPALLRGEAPDQLSRTDPTDDWSIDPSVGAWAAVADLRGIPLVDARALAPTDDLRALEASAATPVANWYGDATGRFAFRYWDGEQWTGWVAATSGAVAADPAPVRHDQGPSGNPAEVAVVGLPIPPPAN